MSHLIRNSTIAVLLGLTALSAQAEDPLDYEATARPFIEKYCIDCHDEDVTKGDLNIDRFDTFTDAKNAVAIWDRMGKRIASGEMPPKKKKMLPTDEEKEAFNTWLGILRKASEVDCNQIASEESASWYRGYVMSRRLNRDEYQNSLQHLFNSDIKVTHLFPADGSGGEGFNNNGDSLFLSAIQVEKYLEAADRAVEEAIPAKSRSPIPGGHRYPGRIKKTQPQDQQRKAMLAALIPVRPDKNQNAQEAARIVITEFAAKAWRRPVIEEELTGIMTLFNQAYDRDDGYESALRLAFKAILVSPNFIFLAEPEPQQPGNYVLNDYPLAAKLSYFLWGSLPDDELRTLAAEGKLQDIEELQRQVKRMLQDPKAEALGHLFASQWMGITSLGETVKPDEDRFQECDPQLIAAMHEEAAQYFNRIIREDRSLLELIDSNYTYANERLATLYGFEGIEGDTLQLVEHNNPARGGLLGMAAVLTNTSQPLRTSPVLRGKWVMETLLGERVPPPPANVPALPEDDVNDEGLSFRQQLEIHRKNPECASCHDKMDPLGFGLENYDPIGRWRDTQGGQPVDSNGVLSNGESFTGPAELKAILMKRKDAFANNLSRKMLGYALGRSLSRYDNCVVTDCVEILKGTDYRPSALFTEIILSYPFRHRYSGYIEPEETT